MSTRLISPLKRKNSSQYWFRMVVPPRYREQIGKAEIKQSLGTDDIGEARRLCAARQHDWLKKFELIELELKARDTLAGTDAIDGYLNRLSVELGSMDKAISYELEGIALAEADHLECPTLEELGLQPGDSHPLVDSPYPAYGDPDTGRVHVGWNESKGAHGLIVNGNDVVIHGLFVEHFQQYQTIWNGARGQTLFYQNELPYDPPNQQAWMAGPTRGWAAYKIAPHVTDRREAGSRHRRSLSTAASSPADFR